MSGAKPAPLPKSGGIRASDRPAPLRRQLKVDARSRASISGTLYNGHSYGFGVGYGGGFGGGFGGGGSLLFSGCFGAGPFDYAYNHRPYYGFGAHPYWYGRPKWYPWSPSPYELRYGYAFARGNGFLGARWRFGVGFGFSYCPRWFRGPWHPFYRCYDYYPYSYYNTVPFFPSYSSVYHESYRVVEYRDTGDPYVDFIDAVPVAAGRFVPSIPDAFARPFVKDFPEGLGLVELALRGRTWMREGKYLFAAEAFRRVWGERGEDHDAPLRMGHALAGAGRFGLASFAIVEAFDRNERSREREDDIREEFPSKEAFTEVVRSVQRHVVRNPRDGEARFLLGYLYLFSDNPFGAHTEFQTLDDGGWDSPHTQPMLEVAKKRLLDK